MEVEEDQKHRRGRGERERGSRASRGGARWNGARRTKKQIFLLLLTCANLSSDAAFFARKGRFFPDGQLATRSSGGLLVDGREIPAFQRWLLRPGAVLNLGGDEFEVHRSVHAHA